MNALYANFMPYLEIMASQGNEEKFFNDGVNETERLIGKKPIAFKDWVVREKGKGYWG